MKKNSVFLQDSVFAPRQRINISSTIPSAVKRCEETGHLEAFKLNWTPDSGKQPPMFYWDSDVAKVVEGMAYVAGESPEIASRMEEIISLIISARQPDGYLNTYYPVTDPDKRWSNLFYKHELYCAGHLTEAAVAHFEATGKRNFLEAMCSYCDYICEVFGKDGKQGYPGHQELELALIKLYRVTGNKKYLDQAKLFIDRRGTEPNYFVTVENISSERLESCQAHKPVREQKEAVGHCVRALYLYSAMADLAVETEDDSLLAACETLFDDLVQNKIFITGGVGSQQIGEVIGGKGDQVPERSYAESCAAIALVLFASRMVKITGKVKYADVLERSLYNCAMAGLSLSGDKFFYANLHACHKNAEYSGSVSGTRQLWHSCSCCPTNYCRFLPQTGDFCYRSGNDFLAVDIPAAAEVKNGTYCVKVSSKYPYDGKVEISCLSGNVEKLSVRIPSWCRKYTAPDGKISDGYWQGKISAGEILTFGFDMPVEKIFTSIPSLANQAAICRGPLVYCVELPFDSEISPFEVMLSDDSRFEIIDADGLPEGTKAICFNAMRINKPDQLYSADKPQRTMLPAVTAIPYALWQNRGETEMTIFMPCC